MEQCFRICGKTIHMDDSPDENGQRIYQFRVDGTIFGSHADLLLLCDFILKNLNATSSEKYKLIKI